MLYWFKKFIARLRQKSQNMVLFFLFFINNWIFYPPVNFLVRQLTKLLPPKVDNVIEEHTIARFDPDDGEALEILSNAIISSKELDTTHTAILQGMKERNDAKTKELTELKAEVKGYKFLIFDLNKRDEKKDKTIKKQKLKLKTLQQTTQNLEGTVEGLQQEIKMMKKKTSFKKKLKRFFTFKCRHPPATD